MEPNEKIGPYRLIEPLGSGGMGTVWRAWDARLKRLVALKRILLNASEDRKLKERLRREAEAAARLNHPTIVHVYDILETEEADWIVMELVDGWTLQEMLQEGPLELTRILRLGREIADGLAEAHARGLVHRDLKASNVMETRAGRAKILDFGVAKQTQPETPETTLSEVGLVVGTFHAMSPEQAMGLSLDGRSDLFSFGSLLYEMVSGTPPFKAETPTATLARVCSFRQRPTSIVRADVPRAFSDLIDRLLEKDPADRPASAAEVSAALAQIAAAPASRREPDPSDQQETALDLPGGPASAPSWPESTPGRPLPAAVRIAPEATVRSASTPGPKGPLRRAQRIRLAVGISLLGIAAILTVYLLRPPLFQPSPYTLYQQGLVDLDRSDKQGNLDRAIDSFQRVLAQDKNHAAAHAGLARAYWLNFDGSSRDSMWLHQALAMGERAVSLDPYLAAARISLGLALNSAGRQDEALQHIQRAIALEPRNGDAYYAAGRVYGSQGKLQEAEAAYKKAIEAQPQRLFFDELGSLYFRMGRTKDAIASFRRSIQLTPDCAIGYQNLGAAYYMQGDLAEAASQFQKALQIQPNTNLYANLGTIQFAQGFYQQSVEAFEKVLDMPGGSNNDVVWGNLGDAYRWTPDKKEKAHTAYRTAIQLLEEKLGATPKDPTLRSRLALYLAKDGEPTKALVELDWLEKFPGKDASSWSRMVVAYEVCARREKALAALFRALRAGLPLDEVKKDPELLGLRADARYHRLAAELSGGGS